MRNNPAQPAPRTAWGINVSPRLAGRVAGWAILAMALIAPFAEFYVRQRLVVPKDAGATATNLAAHETLFRLGIVAFLVVIILDVVVAWGLYVLLKPVSTSVAVLMAWARLVYAVIFAVAVVNLLNAIHLVTDRTYQAAFPPTQRNAQTMASLNAFSAGWAVALVFFGIHLILVGYLAIESGYVPKLIGVLLVIAGLGYTADSFIGFLVPDYVATAALFTFVGELVLALWLVIRGKTIPDTTDTRTNRPGGHPATGTSGEAGDVVKDPITSRA